MESIRNNTPLANLQVFSTFDELNDMLFMSFIDTTHPGNSITLAWHEPSEQFRFFFSFIPEFMHVIGVSMVSFNQGNLWLHNSDNVPRNNFYGVQYTSKIKVIINKVPGVKKVLDSIRIMASTLWNVTSIVIPKDSTYSRGMQSYIPPLNWKTKEGIFYSNILGNQLTNSTTPQARDLYAGDRMRGEYAEIILENTDTTEADIKQIDVNMSQSII